MNIQEIGQKCKLLLANDEFFIALLLTLSCVASFGLGRASLSQNMPTQGGQEAVLIGSEERGDGEVSTPFPAQGTEEINGEKTYVASKNGARYHYPWCSGAQNIKEENKLWFATKEAAEAAGYTPAQNCDGL